MVPPTTISMIMQLIEERALAANRLITAQVRRP